MSFPDTPRLLQTSICSILFLTSACNLIPQPEKSLSENATQNPARQVEQALATRAIAIQEDASLDQQIHAGTDHTIQESPNCTNEHT